MVTRAREEDFALAVTARNFWRTQLGRLEMGRPCSTPVQNQAHDGLGLLLQVCVAGCVHPRLLEISFAFALPRVGEIHADDPAAFMAFIGGIDNPNGAAYVKQVMDLVPQGPPCASNNAPQRTFRADSACGRHAGGYRNPPRHGGTVRRGQQPCDFPFPARKKKLDARRGQARA